MSEWFDVKVGMKQGCTMSLQLFNLYMDGMVREVNVKNFGWGTQMVGSNGGKGHVSHFLLDDTALVADSEEQLRRLAIEFGRV